MAHEFGGQSFSLLHPRLDGLRARRGREAASNKQVAHGFVVHFPNMWAITAGKDHYHWYIAFLAGVDDILVTCLHYAQGQAQKFGAG